MLTQEQFDAIEIYDEQIKTELSDYKNKTRSELLRLIQKYSKKRERIINRTEGEDVKNNFDYSVIYDDIETYSKIYTRKVAFKNVRRKYVNSINKYLKLVVEQYELLKKDQHVTNKAKSLIFLKQKITCECGKEVCYVNMIRHKLSNSHIKFIELKNKPPEESTPTQPK